MQFKACLPVIAPYNANGNSISYDTGKIVGKLMKVDVAPAFTPVKVYADDGVATYVNVFKDAAVTLGTNYIPTDCEPIMFGCSYDDKTKTKVDSEDDDGRCVGFGSIYCKKIDSKDVYYMEWLHKVKFTLPSENRTTKGETITFNTPNITGTAYADENGEWRTTTEYTSLEAAKDALFAKANITT